MQVYVQDNGITYIYKHKDELTAYERLLIKGQPEKYIRKNPKSDKKEKKTKSKEELIEKANAKLWKEVDRYEKNPKKYKKKMTKRDKMLSKYFKKQKHNKKNKEELSKKEKFARKNIVAYADMIDLQQEKSQLMLVNNKSYNGSRAFMNNLRANDIVSYEHDNKKAILKALEDELLDKLNGDMFESDRFIVEYHNKDKDGKKSKKKKKKKFKNVREVEVDEEYINNLIYL